jgi:hypothetical protein
VKEVFGKPLIGHRNTRRVLAGCAARTRAARVPEVCSGPIEIMKELVARAR